MIAAAALLLAVGAAGIGAMWLVRLVLGPNPLDRTAAAFAFSQSCVVLIGALSVALARAQWLQITFALLLAGLAVCVAALKRARYHSLQPRLAHLPHANQAGLSDQERA